MPTLQKSATDSLIERARKGCRSARNLLLTYVRPELHKRASAQLNKTLRRKEDVSDRVQEALFKIGEQMREFKGRGYQNFRNWAFKIQDNDVRKQHRFYGQKKRDRNLEQLLSQDGGGTGALAGSTTSIPDRLEREEELEQLRLALSWCSDDDRSIILLRFFEDQSHEEIAAHLGISCDAARKRFSRAIRNTRMAKQLLSLMTKRAMTPRNMEVVGLRQFQGLSPATIATRLNLPQKQVELWLGEAEPLIRALGEDRP